MFLLGPGGYRIRFVSPRATYLLNRQMALGDVHNLLMFYIQYIGVILDSQGAEDMRGELLPDVIVTVLFLLEFFLPFWLLPLIGWLIERRGNDRDHYAVWGALLAFVVMFPHLILWASIGGYLTRFLT